VRANFDRARFVAGVADHPNEAVRAAIFALLDFAELNATEVRGGQAESGSFHYAINVANRIVNLFTCNASGYVSISFANFQYLVPNRAVSRFSGRLLNVGGIGKNVREYPARPGFSIEETIVDPKIMSKFQSAVLSFQKEVDAQ